MAAAEARAAWQRAANRYFVQEDAKRAPRLARCPSSTLLSKQSDTGPINPGNDRSHQGIGFTPSTTTSSYSNLPPDVKWWVQTEPNYRVHHHRHLSADSSSFTEIAAMSDESIMCEIGYEDLESFLDVKKCCESKQEEEEEEVEVTSVVHDNKIDQDFLDVKNMMTDYYEVMEMDVGGYDESKTSELSSDMGSLIGGGDKAPWWRVTDGEELASFVAQKSFHHIENCDLPPPQKMCVRSETSSYSLSSGGSLRKHWCSLDEGSSSHIEHSVAAPLRAPEKGTTPMSDPCRAKLLEALCHSQTRAREAEKAAKEAYSEKEHLLKLFFRQASHLFAYKQWLKLLQLEALLLQRKNEANPNSGFSDLVPCLVSQKPRKLHQRRDKHTKARQRKRSYAEENEMGKYSVAFALGFTLVGAGLVLGWTVGWLYPSF